MVAAMDNPGNPAQTAEMIRSHPADGPRRTYCILLGGDLTVTNRLRHQIAGTRAIAADGGMAHAAELGLAVDLWVGDFDSASAELQAAHRDIPRQTHATDKDRTDGEIAIDAALAAGATDLILVGALGGQTDHALGNMALLLSLSGRQIDAYATSGREEAYPLTPGGFAIDLAAGSRLSIIALSPLLGLDISGVRWPLAKADVKIGSTWTLSNVAAGPVSLGLISGTGLVLAYPLED
jgi:thiamine pyrophosphokinase